MFYCTFDFDKYLNDLTKGNVILNDLVQSKLVNLSMLRGCTFTDSKKCLDLINYLQAKYGYKQFDVFYNRPLALVQLNISFKLAVEFLKHPEKIFGKGTQPPYAFEFDCFLRELVELVIEQTSSFVKKIKQEQLELQVKAEQEQLELERKKEQEQLELKRKAEQERLELQRKAEQEQLELERKKEQEQLKKQKEENEKKEKQNRIDTIVSYYFNRNLKIT